MALLDIMRARSERRLHRIKARIRGTSEQPRLAVARSLSHISAQIIDDSRHQTVVAAHDRELATELATKSKTERATEVGKLLAERAKGKGVTRVVFDRRDKRYHGRVRALAEGARKGGLEL